MQQIECEFEADVLAAAMQSRWPERVDAELRRHVAGCEICSDAASVASAVSAAHEELRAVAVVPDSGRVWWLAQMRARREAVKTAARPLTAVQVLAFACGVGLVGACFGATSSWFQMMLDRIRVGGAAASLLALIAGHMVAAIGVGIALFLIPAAVYLTLSRD